MANALISKPIGIIDEHPEWSSRLISELEQRRLAFEKVDHSNHAFDPRDRRCPYSVVVNRTSPSSHRRGHASVLFYTEALLAHYEAQGVPVVNPVSAYRYEKSKALQVELFERLGIRYPRTIVVNHPGQIVKTLDRLRLPLLVKPNVGGSGAGIQRFDTLEQLEARAADLDFGPDGVALVQEMIEPRDGAIVRVEVMEGQYLYAVRIVRAGEGFNLCPADICQAPESRPAASDMSACPAELTPASAMTVRRHDPPGEVIEQVLAIAAAASIDIGGVEYLVGRDDGQTYFYDVNATSNFVANAPAVVGFDPIPRFVDYLVRVATRALRPAA